ncbi:MAG: cysteine desulfurase [Bradymonadales bacterium]|nr:cysteine desulfurase [Bradymonadales bacterium]
MIYLDHNATTPLHPRVFEAMLPYLRERWGNPSSPYRFGNQARAAVERSRRRIAECLSCSPTEILFCSSGTEADNLALRGVAHALGARGNHIVTTAIEHHAVLNTCKALESEGFRITYLPVNEDGIVQIETLASVLDDQTILVSVMHANNETGVIQPIKEIADIARKRGVLLHSDTVQTVGKLNVQLADLGVDLAPVSAHKIYGPKGIAALYVREGTPLAPVITGGAQEGGLRAGTENVAGIVGLAEAVALAVEHRETEGKRLAILRDRLEKGVRESIREVRINGARAPRVPNTSNMSFSGVDGESIVLGLDLCGICLSTGSACSTGDPEPSHVLMAMGINAREAQGSIRISLGRDTERDDIDATVQALAATVERLRAVSSIQGSTEPQ